MSSPNRRCQLRVGDGTAAETLDRRQAERSVPGAGDYLASKDVEVPLGQVERVVHLVCLRGLHAET